MKNLQHQVCIFCAETLKENAQLLLNIFFYVVDCGAASRNISMFLNERAIASERYQWTTASERKCAPNISLCVAASRNISMFFKWTCGCFWKTLMSGCFWKKKNVLLKRRIHCEIFLSRHLMKYSFRAISSNMK